MVNVAGYKVNLLKIECAFGKVEGIEELAVLSRSHSLKGQEIIAFIVINASHTLEEIRPQLIRLLSPLERPNKIIQIPQLPCISTGKVQKTPLLTLLRD